MKILTIILTVLVALTMITAANATNGTNVIGIGPISRSMGGGGVAAPQDAVSAIFANPAAVCFGPFCPKSSFDFTATWFDPTVEGEISGVNPMLPPPSTYSLEGKSKLSPFVVPAIGITTPINEKLRFGLGMFGVSGLGADYKGTEISADTTQAPLYTQLQTLKFAPNLAYMITPNLSVGFSLEVVWQNLDLGSGSTHGYTIGSQIGALYHIGDFNIGVSYTTPESVKHKRVADLDGDTLYDDLKIESPQTFKLGLAYQPNTTWLIEANTRWYNWEDADGYGDFDWEDQWVFAIGAQWRPIDKLAIRLGYNYGKNPIDKNNGFDPDPTKTVNVQGADVPTANFETLRVLGFPAIAEHHYTAGVGYNLSESWVINFSFMYSPKEKFKESSEGRALNLETELQEWSATLGLTCYF